MGHVIFITFREMREILNDFHMVIKMVRMVIFYAEKSNHSEPLIFLYFLPMVIMVINVYT